MSIKPGFFPQEAVRSIVSHLKDDYPTVFLPERIQVVGIDVPPAQILDNGFKLVEPRNGCWNLKKGSYQFQFGFEFPDTLKRQGITPRLYWRSSNHRLGVGGGDFIAHTNYEEKSNFCDLMFGGEIIGNYHVWNPYGVTIEQGASVAQACFTLGGITSEIVSPLLEPQKVMEFIGSGKIGKEKTTLPERQEVPIKDGRWNLRANSPYLVEFRGQVSLKEDEVLVPSKHFADLKNKNSLLLGQYSCLGDPGYHGRLGMLVIPVGDGVSLSPFEGIARVAKQQVISFGQPAMYQGQWQNEGIDIFEPEIEFRPLLERPELIGVEMPDLRTLMKKNQ